ncbi:MAG: hypothetical protein R6T99_11375 [Bacteroidales bacterium]
MKKAITLSLTCLAIIIYGTSTAQKIMSASGDASALKGQKNVNLEFTYEDVMVGEMTEEAYIEKRMSEYREDSPGEAGKWLEEWKSNREYYETFFVERLNKKLRKFQTEFGENQQDAEYSLFINIYFIEVGWFGGLVSGFSVMFPACVCSREHQK